MKINVEFGNGVISLPEKVLDILHSVSELELKLLVFLSSEKMLRESFSHEDAALALSVNTDQIRAAVKYLSEKGLISIDGEKMGSVSVRVKKSGDKTVTVVKAGNDIPTYTGAEIEQIFAHNEKLGGLVDSCQRILGKMFTLIEINKVIHLSDYYRLDNKYIEMLFSYAASIGKTSVPYVDKMAREFYDQGIMTVSALDNKLQKLKEFSTLEGFVRKLFGMGERKLTAKESRFIEQWVEFKYPSDIIELAYEIMIDNGKEASMPYMNKVLTNWRDAGHRTSEEILASIDSYRRNKNSTPYKKTNDLLEEEIFANSMKIARKLLGEDDD